MSNWTDKESTRRLQIPYPIIQGPFGRGGSSARLEVNPAVFSFVFGIPSPEILKTCRERGIVTAGGASTVNEALVLEEAGVDFALRAAALVQGRTDLVGLWAGQAAPLVRYHKAAELFEAPVRETNEILNLQHQQPHTQYTS